MKEERALPRLLGTWDGLAILIGRVIGTGIFLTAPMVAAKFSSAGPAILVWIIGAVLTLLGAMTFAELAAARPKTGGAFVFLLEGYGRPIAFVSGWKDLLAGPAGVGALAVAFANFFVDFFHVNWPEAWVAVATLLLLTTIAVAGTKYSVLVMKVFTPLKLLTLAAIVGLGIFLLAPGGEHFANMGEFAAAKIEPPAEQPSFLSAFGLAIIGVIWTFGGWESIAALGGEVRDPQKNLPRILIYTILIVAAVYMAVNLTYIRALGVAGLGETTNAARDIGTLMIGPGFGAVVTLMILCSVFSGFNSNLLSGGRTIFALANAGMTFGFLGARSRRFGTPHNALIWRGLVGCGFVLLWPSFFDLLRYEIFAAMVFLILVGCSLFIFRRRGGELPFKIPGYPWTPLVYIALNAAILGNELWNRPREGTIIIGIVLAGIPVYYLWRAVVLWSERRRPGTEKA